MKTYSLRFDLLSDAVFGSGSGMNSQVDIEIQHDQYGCPFLGGRAIKGVLFEECNNLLFSLFKQGRLGEWPIVAKEIFGKPGLGYDQNTFVRFGNAGLSENLHAAIVNEVKKGRISPDEVFQSFTCVRYQTAVDILTGSAKDKSLRSKYVLLRHNFLVSKLTIDTHEPKVTMLISACVKTFRRAGLGRNRGAGEIKASIWEDNNDITNDKYLEFKALISEVKT